MTKSANSKYLTISKEIIHKIQSGELQAGDKVPSENELIKIYKVIILQRAKVYSKLS